MADLTTLEEVRRYLGIGVSDTDSDELLASLITSESAWFEGECGREIITRSYTEALDGNGRGVVYPRAWPIVSVTSLAVDGVTVPARAGAGTDGYLVKSDKTAILLFGYTATRGTANVEIVYTAGFGATPPADVSAAVQQLVSRRFRMRDKEGVSSQIVGGEVMQYSGQAGSLSVQATIDRYKVPVVG